MRKGKRIRVSSVFNPRLKQKARYSSSVKSTRHCTPSLDCAGRGDRHLQTVQRRVVAGGGGHAARRDGNGLIGGRGPARDINKINGMLAGGNIGLDRAAGQGGSASSFQPAPAVTAPDGRMVTCTAPGAMVSLVSLK
jgi:hypothetical protein